MKLLGVTIDESLNFSRHIGEVCKTAWKLKFDSILF